MAVFNNFLTFYIKHDKQLSADWSIKKKLLVPALLTTFNVFKFRIINFEFALHISSYMFSESDLVSFCQVDICRGTAEFGNGTFQLNQSFFHQPGACDVVRMAVGVYYRKKEMVWFTTVQEQKLIFGFRKWSCPTYWAQANFNKTNLFSVFFLFEWVKSCYWYNSYTCTHFS